MCLGGFRESFGRVLSTFEIFDDFQFFHDRKILVDISKFLLISLIFHDFLGIFENFGFPRVQISAVGTFREAYYVFWMPDACIFH